MKYFENIIGQDSIKNQLSFQLEAYKRTSFLPPSLFTSKRGSGKTEIARSMKEYLTDPDGKKKPFIEINGASLKNPGGLVNKAFIPYQDAYVTYFIDEAHAMNKVVEDFLLSVISPNTERCSVATYDGMDLKFNFRMQSFIFATTDPQKLSAAFKSRCKRIDLQPYTNKDISDILKMHARKNEIFFKDKAEEKIATICRNTPREAIKILDDIRQFCDIKDANDFDESDWENLCKRLDIKPLGLTNTELETLNILKKHGEMSLTHIANTLSLRKTTVQGDVEPFLMEKGLIKIDVKRSITKAGLEILKNY